MTGKRTVRAEAPTKLARGAGQKTTIVHVARAAGVSPMTVSRVLNGEARVHAETRKRVQAAMSELRYAPNPAARSLGGKKSVRISLLYANPSAGYLSELLIGALEQCRLSDGHLLLEKCDGDDDVIAARIASAGADGAVLIPPFCESAQIIEALVEAGIAVVNVAGGERFPEVSSVRIDEFEAARSMTQHLLSLGHRRIGFICGHPDLHVSELRLKGHLQAMRDAGVEPSPELRQPGRFDYRSGLAASDALLSLPSPPTAIFASNDDMAAAAISMAQRRGLSVPNDLTVCGFDDSPIAATVWPELTTIRQPIAEMAMRAVELLTMEVRAARAGGRQTPTHAVFEVAMVRRLSDSLPPVAKRKRKRSSSTRADA